MSLWKNIKKAAKKLGKQIKTNFKHGAKYIVPVLVSAMTGGFGSGIVKTLFGGKIAGALANFGSKALGGLVGQTRAVNDAKKIADGAQLVSDGAGALTEAVNSAAPYLKTASIMLPGLNGVANTALSPVLSTLSTSKNIADGIGALAGNAGTKAAAKALIDYIPGGNIIDKGMQQVLTTNAINNATGKYLKTYGNTSNAGNTGTGSTVGISQLEILKTLPQNMGERAKPIEVDPTNIADTKAVSPISTVSPFSQEELSKAVRAEWGYNDDEEEKYKNGRRWA